MCEKTNKHQVLLALLESDAPESAIIFVGEQVLGTSISLMILKLTI